MRWIIAGSRDIDSHWAWDIIVTELGVRRVDTVVSGTARGVDSVGADWAESRDIAVQEYPADWAGLGKRAGYVRNVEMANNADALLAIWDGESRGTKHMIEIAISYRLDPIIVRVING